jgi:protein O-mannosyl-transferase
MVDNSQFTGKQFKIISILILIILNMVIYWNIQNHSFINYDDQLYVTANHRTQAGITLTSVISIFTDTHTGNWHPLTMMSHMLDWQLFREKAGGHHWTSLIIHIFNTILLFVLINKLTGAIWRSFLVASLFAVHPINVESVAWIAERKNVLSTFFWIMTMLLYVSYVKQPGWKTYLPVFLCFALGLMSKPMLVTLPFVLLLLDYWPLNRMAINTQDEYQAEIQPPLQRRKAKLSFLILEKIPLFILTAISICVTLYTQYNVKAVVNLDSLPIFKRISNAVLSYGLYIKTMFYPINLSVFYPQYDIGLWDLLLASSFLIFLSAIVIRYYRKRPYLPVGWLWYLGTLVPVIGLVQVGAQSMADRYAYVPFIGLFIMLVWFLADIVKRNACIKFSLILTSFVVILILSVLSWQRCQLWGDQFALWNDVLKNHKVAFAYNFRGLAYVDKGQYSLALTDYNIAIARDKKFAEAINNRGILYYTISQYKNALNDYNQAIKLEPKFADAYYNRGLLYLQINHLDDAIADFTTAIKIDPDMADYFNNRGVALRLKGEYEKSFADFSQALKINQNLAEAYFNRGIIYNIHNQYIPAIANYTEALKIKPQYTDAYFSRGVSFAFLGKYDQAIKDFNHVLQIDPEHIVALNNLGMVLKNMKRYEESSMQFKKILKIKPNDQEALKNLKEIEAINKRINSPKINDAMN